MGVKTMSPCGYIPTEAVNQAVIDKAEGNRPLTSRAYLERRISEIHFDQQYENQQFENWKKTFFTVRAWERNYKG